MGFPTGGFKDDDVCGYTVTDFTGESEFTDDTDFDEFDDTDYDVDFDTFMKQNGLH